MSPLHSKSFIGTVPVDPVYVVETEFATLSVAHATAAVSIRR